MSRYSRKPGKGVLKYRNTPTVVDGIRFASKLEAKRWGELKLLERAGKITQVQRQFKMPLIIAEHDVGTYVADFFYSDLTTGKIVVEDAKGKETAEFKIKWKLAQVLYAGFDFRLYPPRAKVAA